MWNFARQLWFDYNPHFLLSAYLRSLGHDAGSDARAKFIELEKAGDQVNIERFFAFAYQLRHLVLPGNENFVPSSEYENLLLHGILSPLTFILIQGLLRPKADGAVDLPLARRVAARLRPDDLVVNLNYDTIFELGAEQAGHQLSFIPGSSESGRLSIAKPHGSFNLFINKSQDGFWFSPTLFAGGIQPGDGSSNFAAFVPPRFGKTYAQHPVAAAIIQPLHSVEPWVVTFWGIGLTDSDTDLLDLFRFWSRRAAVEFVNPDKQAAYRASALLGVPVCYFRSLEDWERQRSEHLQARSYLSVP